MYVYTQGYAAAPFQPAQPLTSGGVGVIRASKSDKFKEAEVVTGMMPWVTHFVLADKQQVWVVSVSWAMERVQRSVRAMAVECTHAGPGFRAKKFIRRGGPQPCFAQPLGQLPPPVNHC